MISREEYIQLVQYYFNYLIKDFDYEKVNVISRKNLFYDVEYKKNNIVISISYQNREDYLQVILFKLKDGKIPDYDNKELTIHLNKLNSKIKNNLSYKEYEKNNSYFSLFVTSDKLEKNLLKKAKELRLCLKNIDFSKEV